MKLIRPVRAICCWEGPPIPAPVGGIVATLCRKYLACP